MNSEAIMQTLSMHEEIVLAKIRQLSASQQAEVENFIDFLNQRSQDRQLTADASQAALSTFEQIWNNPEDAVYDNL